MTQTAMSPSILVELTISVTSPPLNSLASMRSPTSGTLSLSYVSIGGLLETIVSC